MAKVWLRKRALLATLCLAVLIVFALRQKGETDSDVGGKIQSENYTENTICGSSVKLNPFIPIEGDEGRKRMFFIETSGGVKHFPAKLKRILNLFQKKAMAPFPQDNCALSSLSSAQIPISKRTSSSSAQRPQLQRRGHCAR